LAAAGLWLAFAAAGALAIEAGQLPPDIGLSGSGVAGSLSDLHGKLVYLDFWASWCGPCRKSFPWMNDMQKKYGSRGLQVVGINLDLRRADAERFLAEFPAHFALAFDAKGETARRFGVKGMPTSVLIGADGKVLWVREGFRDEERNELEARFVGALTALPK
jgi:cytochrome c biogenesis protein CcmG, thiol:disulfide interchange protein DsbE